MINKQLAQKMKLSEDRIKAIEVVQEQLKAFLARPTMYAENKDCANIVTSFELVLQNLWNFPMDIKFHRYQFDLEGCICPKLDNQERVGHTETRIYNTSCPFHGGV